MRNGEIRAVHPWIAGLLALMGRRIGNMEADSWWIIGALWAAAITLNVAKYYGLLP